MAAGRGWARLSGSIRFRRDRLRSRWRSWSDSKHRVTSAASRNVCLTAARGGANGRRISPSLARATGEHALFGQRTIFCRTPNGSGSNTAWRLDKARRFAQARDTMPEVQCDVGSAPSPTPGPHAGSCTRASPRAAAHLPKGRRPLLGRRHAHPSPKLGERPWTSSGAAGRRSAPARSSPWRPARKPTFRPGVSQLRTSRRDSHLPCGRSAVRSTACRSRG